jgi:hypothetical protein
LKSRSERWSRTTPSTDRTYRHIIELGAPSLRLRSSNTIGVEENRRDEGAPDEPTYDALRVETTDDGVLSVVIDAPPINLIGPELVRDLVSLLGELESEDDVRVVLPESADPEYFVAHVDLTKVAEYTAEAAKAGGLRGASRRRRRTTSRAALGARTGHGGDSRCGRFRRRHGRAVRLDQPSAARCRARRLRGQARPSHRIIPHGRCAIDLQVLNEQTMPGADAIRADARRFQQLVRSEAVQTRVATLFEQGLQTRGPLERDLGDRLELL